MRTMRSEEEPLLLQHRALQHTQRATSSSRGTPMEMAMPVTEISHLPVHSGPMQEPAFSLQLWTVGRQAQVRGRLLLRGLRVHPSSLREQVGCPIGERERGKGEEKVGEKWAQAAKEGNQQIQEEGEPKQPGRIERIARRLY